MSTGYGWEGIRQVCATLLGARHVPERLCGGLCLQRSAIASVRPLPFTFKHGSPVELLPSNGIASGLPIIVLFILWYK